MDNSITIKIGNKSKQVKVPESWNSLDTRELLLFYQALFEHPGDEFTATGFTNLKLINMACAILNVDLGFMRLWEAQRQGEHGAEGELIFLSELNDTIRFALCGGEKPDCGLFSLEEEDGETRYAARLNLTENPWPILTGPGKTKAQKKRHYYAPADGLENLTIYEMGMAFQTFENYLSTNDAAYAHQLIALLYRPSRPETKIERESAWGGDRRQPIRRYEGKISERVNLVKTLPPLVQRVVVFWFASCRQQIADSYPKVFKAGGERGKSYGWGGVLLSVAENGALGTLGEVSDQHYSNVLTFLEMKANEAEECQRKSKRGKG